MFKDKLKQLREEKGLTQKELGEKIYVSRSAICKWEMGNGVPSDVNIDALCKFFNVDEEWLLDRNDMKEMVHKLQKNKIDIFSIIDIILPLFFIFVSCLPIYSFKCGDGQSCIAIYIQPKSMFSSLNIFMIIPLSIYLYTLIVSILYMCKVFKNGKTLLVINMIISIICFICVWTLSSFLAF